MLFFLTVATVKTVGHRVVPEPAREGGAIRLECCCISPQCATKVQYMQTAFLVGDGVGITAVKFYPLAAQVIDLLKRFLDFVEQEQQQGFQLFGIILTRSGQVTVRPPAPETGLQCIQLVSLQAFEQRTQINGQCFSKRLHGDDTRLALCGALRWRRSGKRTSLWRKSRKPRPLPPCRNRLTNTEFSLLSIS